MSIKGGKMPWANGKLERKDVMKGETLPPLAALAAAADATAAIWLCCVWLSADSLGDIAPEESGGGGGREGVVVIVTSLLMEVDEGEDAE